MIGGVEIVGCHSSRLDGTIEVRWEKVKVVVFLVNLISLSYSS